MDLKPKIWILGWGLLWGIPTGFIFSALVTIVKSDTSFGWENFEFVVFMQKSLVFVPLFIFLGLTLGLISSTMAKRK